MEECLKRKLVFGDREQIEALQREKKRIENVEKVLGQEIDGPLKDYYVTVTYSTEDTFTVSAPDIDSARTMAKEDMEEPSYDQEIDIDIYEIKRRA